MSFPYHSPDDGSSFPPPWDTLQHSPLDTPVPTPSSATFRLDMDFDDSSVLSQQQQQQQQSTADDLSAPPPTIDNTPILLHHPGENPQMLQRHRPRAPGTPSMHPIDALILSRSGSASSTPTPMAMSQLITRSQPHYAPSPDPGRPTPVPTPTPGPSSGALRTSTTRTRAATTSSHPYLRQTQAQTQSSSPFIQDTGLPSAATTIMTRSRARKQSVKFANTPTPTPPPPPPLASTPEIGPPMTHHGHGGMVERPVTLVTPSAAGGTGPTMQPLQRTGATFFGTTLMTGPAQPSLLQGTSPAPIETSQRPSPPQTAASQPSTSTHPIRPRSKIPPHRFTTLSVHTDMSYSPQTHTLSCSLELPGVHPSQLRVSLGTCYFNHVKYVGVVGESVPVFGNESVLLGGLRGERSLEDASEEEARRGLRAELVGGIRSRLRTEREGDDEMEGGDDDHIKIGRIVNPNLRERRFGIFRRFIQVPSYTTPKDIAASLKHGVLTLHIYCGAPFEQDDEEEVPVAFE